jgi:hypothetical protein
VSGLAANKNPIWNFLVISRYFELVWVKITHIVLKFNSCVNKSCRYHTRECQNHTHTCQIHTLRVEVSLERVEITVVSVEITVVSVVITFVRVKITLRVEITLCV